MSGHVIIPGHRGRRIDVHVHMVALAYLLSPARSRYGLQKRFALENGIDPRRLNSAVERIKERVKEAA